jgi:hypothetical protein
MSEWRLWLKTCQHLTAPRIRERVLDDARFPVLLVPFKDRRTKNDVTTILRGPYLTVQAI